MSNKRLILIEVAIFLFAAVIIGRLFYWQVLKHSDFTVVAKTQLENTVQIGAKRGKILASDGSILVSNKKVYLMYAILPDIKKLKIEDETYDEFSSRLANKLTAPLLAETLTKKEKAASSEKDKLWDEIRVRIALQLKQPKL